MTIKKGKKLLENFIEAAKKDDDPFFLVHFSIEDGKYNGLTDRLDTFDAMILIKHIVREFKINETLLKTAIPKAKP